MTYYNPIYMFDLFGLKTNPEPFAMALAFIIFGVYVYGQLRKKGFKKILGWKEYAKFLFIVMFSALAGGRLWYYVPKMNSWRMVLMLFDLRQDGLVSVGMIIGGVVGLVIFLALRKEKKMTINFARIADVIAPGAALGVFIYRLFGCFLFGDVVGKATTVPWGLFFIKTGEIKHPTAIYLALSALFIFLILRLFFSYEKTAKTKFGKRFDGEVGLWFLLLYFFNRFFIEFTAQSHNFGVDVRYFGMTVVQ